jgi:membrane associated rhomboid family serine protease
MLSNNDITMPTIIKTTTGTGTSTMILDCHTSMMRQRRFPFLFSMALLLCSFRAHSVLGSLAPTTTTRSALSIRGGKSHIELNPNWVPPGPNPHQVWLETQQTYNDQSFVTYENVGRPQSPSARDRVVNYVSQLHQKSPSLSISAFSCIVVFVSWQISHLEPLLRIFFTCSRQNLMKGRLISLLLSAVSHASFKHLAVNLLALLTAGPVVQQSLSTTRWPLWPLLVGAAMAGSTMFLALGGPHGSCLGLSGVTLSLVAMQARIFPNRQLGLVIGVIPVRLQAEYLLWGLLAWSVFGSLLSRQDGVAHLTHLGGLLFGMAYYELWRNRRLWQPKVRKLLRRRNY